MHYKEFTPAPWESERGFSDSFNPMTGNHSTPSNNYLTIYCGEKAIEADGTEYVDIIEVHGPSQDANGRLVTSAPLFFEACAGLPDLLDQPIDWVAALLEEFKQLHNWACENGYEIEDPSATMQMCQQVSQLIDKVRSAIRLASDRDAFNPGS